MKVLESFSTLLLAVLVHVYLSGWNQGVANTLISVCGVIAGMSLAKEAPKERKQDSLLDGIGLAIIFVAPWLVLSFVLYSPLVALVTFVVGAIVGGEMTRLGMFVPEKQEVSSR